MKTVDYMQDKQRTIIVGKLHELGYTETADKGCMELKRILAIEYYKQIDVENSANNWF